MWTNTVRMVYIVINDYIESIFFYKDYLQLGILEVIME